MPNPLDMLSSSTCLTDLSYFYNDDDDLESIRRWLFRSICPRGWASGNGLPDVDAGEPYLYIWPRLKEGEFQRPGVTLRLLTTAPPGFSQGGPAGQSYDETLVMVATAYGRDGYETVKIAETLRRAFKEGGYGEKAGRVPMWWIAAGVKLARKLRVLPTSLSMGLDNADDESMWQRPLEFNVVTPRVRPFAPAPTLQQIRSTVGA